jgi:hypothetical protein
MKELSFKDAFMYPFNRAMGMLNILWMLLPIIGWFALSGYAIRIIQRFAKGDFKELPKFKFGDNLKLGFFMFFKMLPFMIVFMVFQITVGLIPFIGFITSLIVSIFIVPMLFINFFVKETVAASFEFKILKAVGEDLEEYVIAMLKSIGLQLIFLVMMVILVGIPAGTFTKNIFLADFYRKYIGGK